MESSAPDPVPTPQKPPSAPQAPRPPVNPELALGGQRPQQRRALTPQEIAAKAKAAQAQPVEAPPKAVRAPVPRAPDRTALSDRTASQERNAAHESPASHPTIEPSSRAATPARTLEPKYVPPIPTDPRPNDQVNSIAKSADADAIPPLAHMGLAWWVVTGVALVFLLGLFMPWKPTAPNGPLDGSWNMVLHWAFVHHADFGHDIVFTFGPWGFIWQGYDPATFGWSLLGWALLSAAFFMGIYQLSRYFTNQWWLAGIWLLLVVAVAGSNWLLQDVRLFALGALLLLIHFYVDDRPLTWSKGVITAALALATLMKFSTAFIAIGVVGVITIDVARRRKIPWVGLVYVAAVLAFWLAARQKISSLFPYFYHSWLVASDFAAGQIQAQTTDTRDVAFFLLSAAALLSAVIWAHRVDRQRPALKFLWGILALLGFAVIVQVAFKAGYVRHDGHEMAATTFLLLLTLLYASVLWPRFSNWIGRTLLLVALTGSFALTWYSDFTYIKDPAGNGIGLPQILFSSLMQFPSRAGEALALLTGKSTIDVDYQASLLKIREGLQLPPIDGTVDVLPFEQQVALANNLELSPRPVIASYLAYDKTLENLNADFLRSDKAPQNILFDIAMIDGRYPTLNDALCLPELLTRYDLEDRNSRLLVLKKSKTPRSMEIIPISTVHATLGQLVPVPPAEDPIWVSIDLQQSALYPAISTLYHPPVVWIEVGLQNGKRMQFQLIPEIARNGFLLSPAVLSRTVFTALYVAQWKTFLHDLVVTDMVVKVGNSDGPNSSYAQDYSITFSRMHYPRIVIVQPSQFSELVKNIKVLASDKQPRMVPAENGLQVLVVSGASRLLVPVPPAAKTVQLQFGLPAGAYNGPTKTEGETFLAYFVTVDEKQNSTGTLGWTHKLDPANVEADRGLITGDVITLPSPPPPFLLLETKPVSGTGDACWSDIQFK